MYQNGELWGVFLSGEKNLALVQHDHIDQTRSTPPNGVTKPTLQGLMRTHFTTHPRVKPNMTTMGGGGLTHMFKRRYSSTHEKDSSRSKNFPSQSSVGGFSGDVFFFPSKNERLGFWGVSLLDRTNWTRFRGLYITCRWEKPAWRFHRISVLLKDLRAEKRLTSHRERLDGLWEGCTPGEEILKTSNLELGRVWMIDNYS